MRLFWFLLCAAVWAAAPATVPVTVIRNVTVIDPGTQLVAAHWSVLMAEGKIQALGVIAEPLGAKVIDGTGRFLIPGLWDMHVHLWNADNLPTLYLAFGVTGVRDMGSAFERTVALRKSIEAGLTVGPHILTSGPGIDGKASDEPRLPIMAVSTPDQARRAVDALDDMGVDFVKVFTNIELEPYMAMVERARQLRLPVAGHLPSQVRLEDAIALKQASIEHLFGLEKLRQERLRKAFMEAAGQGVRFVPTLTMHRRSLSLGIADDARFALIPAELKKNWGEFGKPPEGAVATYARYQAMTRWLRDAGVTVLAGSDTGNPFTVPGGTLLDELGLLVEAGLSPAEALRGATSEAARFMGLERMFGSVGVGLVADVVLLDGDPLADIGNVRKVAGVCWRGRYYDGVEGLTHGR